MTDATKRYEVEVYDDKGKLMNTYNYNGGGAARQAESKVNEARRAGRRTKLRREEWRDGKWVEVMVST